MSVAVIARHLPTESVHSGSASDDVPAGASRKQTMLQHIEKMAKGSQAFIKSVQEMASEGFLDRTKALDFIRIVSGFNRTTGE